MLSQCIPWFMTGVERFWMLVGVTSLCGWQLQSLDLPHQGTKSEAIGKLSSAFYLTQADALHF